MATEVNVEALPNCDLCKAFGEQPSTAHYDGRTAQGFWAYMCERHFKAHGVGLGTGSGQRLIKAGGN